MYPPFLAKTIIYCGFRVTATVCQSTSAKKNDTLELLAGFSKVAAAY